MYNWVVHCNKRIKITFNDMRVQRAFLYMHGASHFTKNIILEKAE